VRKAFYVIVAALLLTPIVLLGWFLREQGMKVSQLGKYRGYSRPVYEGWARTSRYLTMRDGTRLAVDLFRPTHNGEPVAERLPVIWAHDRYHRAGIKGGRLIPRPEQEPWLQTVLKHGYVLAVVDVRGGGASFGTCSGPLNTEETRDAYDVTEWLAAQPWCNGRVGMYGRSYLGITQYLAAAAAPPHLTAIFPEMALFDLYSFAYPGGIFRDNFAREWGREVKRLDEARPAPRVDEDTDGSLLAQAVQQHRGNADVFALFASLPYRDSRTGDGPDFPYLTRSPSSYLDGVKRSRVAVYHLAGWYDLWPRDALLWFRNMDNPQKLVIGPWPHGESAGLDLTAEHLRWYDYWLKGIDNGIMSEPPIHYYNTGSRQRQGWREAWHWPPPQSRPRPYYFQAGPSGSIDSVNDGGLGPQPAAAAGRDDYTVSYAASSGKSSRWASGYGVDFRYPDMVGNDRKGLTYTTPPLASDLEVTGHPVVHLWVTSSARDGDFFTYLEDIDANGLSHYVTEGCLRASHRRLSSPPFDNLGLPYHRSTAGDVADLPQEPVELVFDLHPISHTFAAGHRVRVTLTGADRDNTLTPNLSPPPTIQIYHDVGHSSHISLPVYSAGAGGTDRRLSGLRSPFTRNTFSGCRQIYDASQAPVTV
jgi:putative CocE/NonD family hydrolase